MSVIKTVSWKRADIKNIKLSICKCGFFSSSTAWSVARNKKKNSVLENASTLIIFALDIFHYVQIKKWIDEKRPFKVLIPGKQAERGRKKAHHPSALSFTVALCLFWIGKSIRSWQASEWFSPSVFSQLSPPFVCFFANFKLSDAWNFFPSSLLLCI